MQSNHRVHTTSKNLEIPKGEPFSTGGRWYNDKPKTTKIQTNVHTIAAYHIHTPHNTNDTHFCFIHNTHKPMWYLYVLKPYISTHMYHAIEYTIVIYNRWLSVYYNWNTYVTYIIRYMFENNWISNRLYNRLKRLVRIYI